MMKKHPLLLAVVLVVALGAAFLVHRSRQAPTEGRKGGNTGTVTETAGRTAPPFSLNDVDGNKVSSSRFEGKPTVINFFASWCPPCREETPGFVEVYEKYRGKGLEVVGISLDTDTKANLPHFIMQNRIRYLILLGDLPTAMAFGGVNAFPTTFFVGKDGRITKVHIGYMDRDNFEREVQKLL